jgi:hypothetical protein
MGIFFGRQLQYYALIFPTAVFFMAQSTSPSVAWAAVAKESPYVMDGGAGPCSVDLTVTDGEGKPVFSALIDVHIAYGFGGFHKLDLSVYSNNEGKAKFIGLPERVHKPPLEFRAKKDDATGIAIYNPATECHGRHEIVLQKPKQ